MKRRGKWALVLTLLVGASALLGQTLPRPSEYMPINLGEKLQSDPSPPKKGEESITLPSDERLAKQTAQLLAIDKVENLFSSSPDLFGGISRIGSGQVRVYTVNDLPLLSSQLLKKTLDQSRQLLQESGVTLSSIPVKYSLRTLQDVSESSYRDSVLGTKDETIDFETEIIPETNRVQFRVPERDISRIAKIVAERYGDKAEVAEKIYFEHQLSGRYDDTSPFYGGIRLRASQSGAGAPCSAGFTITNAYGQRFLTSAGHCYFKGLCVYNGNFQNTYAGLLVGCVDYNNYQTSGSTLDNLLIGGSFVGTDFAGKIYIGGVNTGTTIRVQNTLNSCTGCQVFTSATFSGQTLLTLTSNTGFCINFSNGRSCSLQRATPGGAQDGDSGSPIWANSGSGGATAVGLLTVGGPDSTVYTRFPPIVGYWQATITTG